MRTGLDRHVRCAMCSYHVIVKSLPRRTASSPQAPPRDKKAGRERVDLSGRDKKPIRRHNHSEEAIIEIVPLRTLSRENKENMSKRAAEGALSGDDEDITPLSGNYGMNG
jgi:hypothetical protein